MENFRYNAQEAAVVPCRVVAQCCHHKGMAQWAMSGPKRITMWVQNEKAVNLSMHRWYSLEHNNHTMLSVHINYSIWLIATAHKSLKPSPKSCYWK